MAKSDKYHHGNLRKALLDAAEQVLRAQGVAGISLRAVARAAGVSHAAPYRHFADKHALLEALAQTGFARLRDAMRAAIGSNPDDARQQMRRAGEAYVELALDNPAMNHLMFGGVLTREAKSQQLTEISEQAFQGLLEVIASAQDSGLLRQRDPKELAAALWSMVHGLAMLTSTGHLSRNDAPNYEPPAMARMLIDMLLDGIAHEPAD